MIATDLAVATSGTYEKGAHIYDPHNEKPSTAILSMSVVGPDILEADVLATATFAMGIDGVKFIEERAGYEAFAIDHDMRGYETSGFAAHCAPI